MLGRDRAGHERGHRRLRQPAPATSRHEQRPQRPASPRRAQAPRLRTAAAFAKCLQAARRHDPATRRRQRPHPRRAAPRPVPPEQAVPTAGGSSSTNTSWSAASTASAQAAVYSAQASVDQRADRSQQHEALTRRSAGRSCHWRASLRVTACPPARPAARRRADRAAHILLVGVIHRTVPRGPRQGALVARAARVRPHRRAARARRSQMIVNTGTMTMTVAFSESDVGKLKVGQTATVTPDALSGVELGAHVTAISPVGTTSSNVVSYNVTLIARSEGLERKAGHERLGGRDRRPGPGRQRPQRGREREWIAGDGDGPDATASRPSNRSRSACEATAARRSSAA